jgi:hypothetical protein
LNVIDYSQLAKIVWTPAVNIPTLA